MPTYEYRCDSCEHQFDIYQSIVEDSLRKCPSCKKLKLNKIISGGAGLVFKGEGFYETDYKRGKGSEYHKKSEAEGGKKKPKEGDKKDSKSKTNVPSEKKSKSTSQASSSN